MSCWYEVGSHEAEAEDCAECGLAVARVQVIQLAARAAKGAGGTAPEATATEAGTYAAIVIYADGSSAAAALAAAVS